MAAIAAPLAAEHYGLNVLDNHVEDDPENSTRFFVLGLRTPSAKTPARPRWSLACAIIRDRCINVLGLLPSAASI